MNGTAAFSLFRGFLFKVFIRRGSRFKLFIPQKTIGRKGCVQVVISNCGTAPRLEIESVVGTNPKPGSFAQKQSGFCALGIYYWGAATGVPAHLVRLEQEEDESEAVSDAHYSAPLSPATH